MALLVALWLSFVRFLLSLFHRSPSHPAPPLPTPVTTRVKEPITPAVDHIFHPPAGPFPNLSLSGLFATTSPRLVPAARSPSHTSPVIVRSTLSPTTMSDGSLEVISLVDPPPVTPLPSPWSPIGRRTPSDVWMSVGGLLMNATGPVHDDPAHSLDRTAMLSPLTLSRMPTTPLYSSSSAFDALGISAFVHLDDAQSTKGNNVDAPKFIQVHDEYRPVFVTQTPLKRRVTLTSITTSNTPSPTSRATKCLSTPLTKLDISHARNASPMSSLAYELRMGLCADGRSMTAFENIIPLLDQASPESIPPHNDPI